MTGTGGEPLRRQNDRLKPSERTAKGRSHWRFATSVLMTKQTSEGGYALIWVLMLSVVLVTFVTGILYATSYDRNYGTGSLTNNIQTVYQSDVNVEQNYLNIQQQISQLIATAAGSGSTVSTALQTLESQLKQQGYMVTVSSQYTDANGNVHVILQITGAGGSTMNLDVVLQQKQANQPVSAQTNPYPTQTSYTQQTGGTYVQTSVGSTPSQTTINGAAPSSGNYMLSLINSNGTPSALSLYGSQSALTFGSPSGSGAATLDELQTGSINMGNTNLTVNGTLDATSVQVNSGGTATVTGDLITNSVNLNNGSTLKVDGQLTCSSLQLTGGSKLVVGSSAITGSTSNSGMELDNNSSLTINTDATIAGGLTLTSGTKLVIQGNLFEDGNIQLYNSSTLQVQGNAQISPYTSSSGGNTQQGNLTQTSGATMTVGQNMCLSGGLTMYNNTTLNIAKQILIAGGATLQGKSFTYQQPLLTSGSCPIPEGGGYQVTAVTQV